MALRKLVELKDDDGCPYGVSGEYHRCVQAGVRSVKRWDLEKQSFVKFEELYAVVELYKSKEFRDQDVRPLLVYERSFQVSLSDLGTKDPKAKAFELLKASDEFTGSEDV